MPDDIGTLKIMICLAVRAICEIGILKLALKRKLSKVMAELKKPKLVSKQPNFTHTTAILS